MGDIRIIGAFLDTMLTPYRLFDAPYNPLISNVPLGTIQKVASSTALTCLGADIARRF
ncbi:MAG: hypothetical protein JW939_07860 [Candidatus Thermoplasmatota archaeon]|nr:hypothetical protein [Candidatus Thermoplasmatota archaeon]